MLYLGLIYLWSLNSFDFEEIEKVLLDPLTNVLWSHEKQYETLPLPFQPLIPASFQAEIDFFESLKYFNKL